jgi:hypothetical protein
VKIWRKEGEKEKGREKERKGDVWCINSMRLREK